MLYVLFIHIVGRTVLVRLLPLTNFAGGATPPLRNGCILPLWCSTYKTTNVVGADSISARISTSNLINTIIVGRDALSKQPCERLSLWESWRRRRLRGHSQSGEQCYACDRGRLAPAVSIAMLKIFLVYMTATL